MVNRIIKKNPTDRESATILSINQDGTFNVVSNRTGEEYIWEGSYTVLKELTGSFSIEDAVCNLDKLTCVKKELRGTTYFSNN